MNEKTLIFIIITILVLIATSFAVFNLPDRSAELSSRTTTTTTTTTQNSSVADQRPTTPTSPSAGEYESFIVYHCDDGDFEICIIRPDGSGFRKLTNNNTDDVNPAINRMGQVAYICTGSDTDSNTIHPEICLVNSDGSNVRQVTSGNQLRPVSRFEELVIDDHGDIFYICRTTTNIEICRVNSDGTGRMQLTSNTQWETNLARNDIGDLAFLCFPEGTQYTESIEICSMTRDGAEFVIYHAHENYENGPVINNSGYIVSNCERALGDSRGLCVIDMLYSDRLHLFEVPEARESGVRNSFVVGQRYALNNEGQIVYQCAFTDATQESELCIINVDGTGFRQLTDNFIDDESPAINDAGVVAYLCGNQLCVINTDGTGFRQLTDQIVLPPGPFAKLKMN